MHICHWVCSLVLIQVKLLPPPTETERQGCYPQVLIGPNSESFCSLEFFQSGS